MSELIISVSGLRGIVGESLTAEVAQRYITAFVETLPAGPIILGRDGRPSGPELAIAIIDSLAAAGRTCIYADIAATPTIGVLVRAHGAAGGVQITASHNPSQYNGLKLFSDEGRVLTSAAGQQVLERYQRLAHGAGGARAGRIERLRDNTTAHLEKVLACVDVPRISQRRYRVLLDTNHGSGSVLGQMLLESLGCEVIVLGGEPDGQFAHVPEPTSENLAGVLARVAESGTDIGFCQDPDADRLAVIDARGRYLGEEYTLALCVDHVLRDTPGAVVINCATSRMSEDLAARYKVPIVRAAVGEANVVELMESYDAVIGGEGNGGVIDPRVVYVRDSFVSMALVLDAMARRELPVADLADELPRYEIVKNKVTLERAKLEAALGAVAQHFAAAEPDTLDGLRLDWRDQWLLIRASNTEPIVRVIAEAPSRAAAQQLCDEAAQVIGQV